MLCSLILDVRVLLPFDVFCFILFPSSICALCSTYYLLVTGTTYSSAAALTLQGLLALCSIALFLPYWQALLTHSARLHGTSYCILLSNYYLFAYSYNTLNNPCLLSRIILVKLPRTVPYFLLSPTYTAPISPSLPLLTVLCQLTKLKFFMIFITNVI